MHQNFLSRLSFLNSLDAVLDYSNYWDFSLVFDQDVLDLSCSGGIGSGIISDDLAVWIDVNESGSTLNGDIYTLFSMTCDEESVTSGFTLYDIGLVGVDNGLVENLSGETLTFISGDSCFYVSRVSGTTYNYDIFDLTDYSGRFSNLCGGFYQGFFKLEGYPYEVIPPRNTGGWTAEIIISITGCTTTGTTINSLNSNNNGFFLYFGTRAENKFHNIFSGETGLNTTSGEPISPQTTTTTTSDFDNTFTTYPCSSTSITSITPLTDPSEDLIDNVFGFRITEEGKIGYRYITSSGACVNDRWESEIYVREGYSELTIYSGNSESKWMYITITFCPYDILTETEILCEAEKRTGLLTFWVNGRRVFSVDDFDEIMFNSLSTHREKQQGVPYNISLGGGSQGLLESFTFGGLDPEDSGLLIEENFAGTTLGGFSQFRYYTRCLDITEIINNYKFEQSRYLFPDTFGGRNIILGRSYC